MNLAKVDQIAKAVLYEGYMLYPYRPSSVKNRQRFNFGVLYPPSFSEAQDGAEASSLRVECLVCGKTEARVECRIRFLHLQTRQVRSAESSLLDGWQEAIERKVAVPAMRMDELLGKVKTLQFEFPTESLSQRGDARNSALLQELVTGSIELSAAEVQATVFKLRIEVCNTTPIQTISSRDEVLLHSVVSAHVFLGVEGGDFVSLLEPPQALQGIAGECHNSGVWPVLVGDPGTHDTLLASPIILYDYPQIAPESAGDLFDGTEIDEILSLRILTLTDEEKQEIRQSDGRAKEILERTENLPAEQFMKLHGAVRGLRPVNSYPTEEEAP